MCCIRRAPGVALSKPVLLVEPQPAVAADLGDATARGHFRQQSQSFYLGGCQNYGFFLGP